MQFEKFWGDKSSFAEAERRHYESLAKGSEKAPKKKASPIREKFWVNKKMYEDAERQYYEKLAKSGNPEDAKCVLPKKEEKVQAAPAVNVPAVNVPAVNVPAVNVPAVNVPAVNVPVVKAPAVNAPAVSAPAVNVVPDKPTAPAVPEKTSKRNRKHKGSTSISVSESSNRDSISEVPLPANDEVPATTSNENPSKKSKKNKNKKNQNQNEKIVKTEEKTNEVCEVPSNLDKGGNVQLSGQCSLAGEVEKARQHIKKSLECMDSVLASVPNAEAANKITFLSDQVSQISAVMNDLRSMVLSMKTDVEQLKATVNNMKQPAAAPAPAPAAPAPTAEDTDDGVDLFASESEDDEEANKIKEARLAAYAAKKSKKPALIAKSSIILDCKPWDDETDMGEMEKRVRVIACDGLLWGASKLVPLAYGIKKLQINCVVEDEKVSIDWLQEEIEKIEDFVQSCDVAAFNKI